METEAHTATAIRGAIEAANRRVHAHARQEHKLLGMGSTVVAAVFDGSVLHVGHAGDSRLYRRRDGELQQLTRDHSLREDLIANGFYSREEALRKVPGNYVTRAVGSDSGIEVETSSRPALSGDLYLLCSDGLTDLVSDPEINLLMRDDADLPALARTLVDAANDAGGRDNVTVALIRVAADESGALQAEMAALSDIGRRRRNNEDCVLLDRSVGLAAVADGMGGVSGGEVAAAITIEVLARRLGGNDDEDVTLPRVRGAYTPQSGHPRGAYLATVDSLIKDASSTTPARQTLRPVEPRTPRRRVQLHRRRVR